ncbi:MAG: hypothetical protein WCO03_01760 [bacterium]
MNKDNPRDEGPDFVEQAELITESEDRISPHLHSLLNTAEDPMEEAVSQWSEPKPIHDNVFLHARKQLPEDRVYETILTTLDSINHDQAAREAKLINKIVGKRPGLFGKKVVKAALSIVGGSHLEESA